MLIGKRVVLAAGAAGVLLVGGGVAGAAIASGPVASGVIHACYTTKASSSGGHPMVLENAGTRCRSPAPGAWAPGEEGLPEARGDMQ